MVSIRRVRPGDAVALAAFYAALSKESRHARFLATTRGLTPDQSRGFCAPDHMHAEGFVAVSQRPADLGTVLGHLCLEPAPGGCLELAVAVADAEQGRGIGRALFRAAIDWATARGYRAIVASCFADNSRVLALLSSAPYPARIASADAGVVDVTIPLCGAPPSDWQAFPARIPHHSGAHAGEWRAIWRPHHD